MRYRGALLLLFISFSGIALCAGQARAAGPPMPPPLAGPGSAKLIQESGGTWTTTVYLDTAALCLGPNAFDLVTTSPGSDTRDAAPRYPGGLQCAAQETHPVTEVVLTFTPEISAVPQTATLAVTPPSAALQQGASPLEIPLTVRRAVSAQEYLWIPAACGAALAVLLVAFTMVIGVPGPNGKRAHMDRVRFWRMPLYASSAWTFGDSWATNVTAVSALIGTVLTASGTVAGLLPGVELGRFSLLIALAGGITVIAPLLFAVLNSRLRGADPTAGFSAIWLPRAAGPHGPAVMIGVPAGGILTVYGKTALPAGTVLDPETTLDVPAGAMLSVSAAKSGKGAASQRVLVLPGGTDVVVAAGARITVDALVPLPASAVNGKGRRWPKLAAAAAADTLPRRTPFEVPDGAKLSFLGRAALTVPKGAWVEAPVTEPPRPPRGPALQHPSEFAVPRGGEVVATQMWTMLIASCLTVFGVGAEIGILGWVLGYDLIVAPQWARVFSAVVSGAAALLFLGYGVRAVLALAGPREGSALSNARGSSFML